MLYSGELRHRITLESPTYVQDSTGDMVADWDIYKKVWAQIKLKSGRELVAAQAEQSKLLGEIIVRYDENITSSMKISYRDKFYNIEAVAQDRDSGLEFMTLFVSEGVRD